MFQREPIQNASPLVLLMRRGLCFPGNDYAMRIKAQIQPTACNRAGARISGPDAEK